jgi:hypothetical protein
MVNKFTAAIAVIILLLFVPAQLSAGNIRFVNLNANVPTGKNNQNDKTIKMSFLVIKKTHFLAAVCRTGAKNAAIQGI